MAPTLAVFQDTQPDPRLGVSVGECLSSKHKALGLALSSGDRGVGQGRREGEETETKTELAEKVHPLVENGHGQQTAV